jgi:hypothetical protein
MHISWSRYYYWVIFHAKFYLAAQTSEGILYMLEAMFLPSWLVEICSSALCWTLARDGSLRWCALLMGCNFCRFDYTGSVVLVLVWLRSLVVGVVMVHYLLLFPGFLRTLDSFPLLALIPLPPTTWWRFRVFHHVIRDSFPVNVSIMHMVGSVEHILGWLGCHISKFLA